MKRWIRNLILLIIPFLVMVLVNEFTRPRIKENRHNKQGISAINSATKTTTKCSWICHNDTNYCKENHVKILGNYFQYTDPVYFGIIKSLKSTGNYGLANIVFLVILFPLFMYFLLIKSLDLQREIKALKFE